MCVCSEGGSNSEAYGHIKESWGETDGASVFVSSCFHCWKKKRSSAKPPANFTFFFLSSFLTFLHPSSAASTPWLNVTHPLTLELKSSPPPALLICSLHYSFITHLRCLCSACMSPFSLYPPRFRLTCRIFSPSGSMDSDTGVGVGKIT